MSGTTFFLKHNFYQKQTQRLRRFLPTQKIPKTPIMQPLLHSSKTLHVSLPFWLNPVIVLFARRTSKASGEFKRSRG